MDPSEFRGYAHEKRTKRDVFLAEMAAVVPWLRSRLGSDVYAVISKLAGIDPGRLIQIASHWDGSKSLCEFIDEAFLIDGPVPGGFLRGRSYCGR